MFQIFTMLLALFLYACTFIFVKNKAFPCSYAIIGIYYNRTSMIYFAGLALKTTHNFKEMVNCMHLENSHVLHNLSLKY